MHLILVFSFWMQELGWGKDSKQGKGTSYIFQNDYNLSIIWLCTTLQDHGLFEFAVSVRTPESSIIGIAVNAQVISQTLRIRHTEQCKYLRHSLKVIQDNLHMDFCHSCLNNRIGCCKQLTNQKDRWYKCKQKNQWPAIWTQAESFSNAK